MTIPRIASLLFMLTVACDASALQMGQASTLSARGQTLSARIGLYGMPLARDVALGVELMPEFDAVRDPLTLFGVSAAIKTEASGESYIALTSAAPYNEATLAFRIRLQKGTRAVVQHFRLTVAAAPMPRPAPLAHAPHSLTKRRTAPLQVVAEVDASPRVQSGSYGPVRAGQSLWRILEETGLARGDATSLMRDIVAANPAAFVAGDASRLRLGAMLNLPTGKSATRITSSDSSPATATVVPKTVSDAELATRLTTLAIKFAEIRARYDAQSKNTEPARTPAPATQTDEVMPATDIATQTPEALVGAAISKPVADPQVQSAPNTLHKPLLTTVAGDKGLVSTLLDHLDSTLLKGFGGLALLSLLIVLGLSFVRRLRNREADAGARSADRELVAEIARKAEKRVQLEGEVKRMIAGRRVSAAEAPAPASNPVDQVVSAHASLEEIETRIAHGQYNEAEAMLEQTIADKPHNFRAKLRLAELYYLNERLEDFADLVDEIHRHHRADIGDDNWARLMRMGKVIAPDRPPFSGPIAVETGRRAS